MKYANIILLLFAMTANVACNKTKLSMPPVSINVVNAMATSEPIVPVFGATSSLKYFSISQSIGYGSSIVYSPQSGQVQLSLVQISDTSDVLYKGTFDTSPGSVYSFFIAGDVLKPDTLWVRDVVPFYSDSSAGVRFVNLSQSSGPISINLEGNPPSQNEFDGLRFRQISSFKKYAAGANMPGAYTFEIRDQASNDLLTTVTWEYTRFRNTTYVISGPTVSGGDPPFLFSYNNF